MAKLRTPEEKMAIVQRCVQLEQEGGDILAYLWSENYISPRATWCNFQREHLHRKPYQYTDGKPKKVMKRKETEGMFRATEEIKGAAIKIALAGGDPKPYLSGLGCEDPVTAWYRIRKDLKDNFPDIAAKLPKRIGPKAEPMKVKPDSKPAEPEKLGPEPAPKVYEMDVVEYPDAVELKPVKDEPKKPGTVPLQYEGFTVRAVENDYGRFYFDSKFNLIDWTTPDGEEVTWSPECWLEIAWIIPKMLAVLGAMPKDEK